MPLPFPLNPHPKPSEPPEWWNPDEEEEVEE